MSKRTKSCRLSTISQCKSIKKNQTRDGSITNSASSHCQVVTIDCTPDAGVVSSLFGPDQQSLPAPSSQAALAGPVSIEELLDANVSDGQFRALVSGASDANDLLSIAAGESQ